MAESNKFGLIIDDTNSEKIFKALIMLSNHKNYKKIQKRILNNIFIDNHEQIKKIDYLRSTFFENNNKSKQNIKI